jgi:hypothetical protein
MLDGLLPVDPRGGWLMRTCAVVLSCLLLVTAVGGQSTRVAIVDVSVVDVERSSVRRNQTVLVEGGLIRDVGASTDMALGEDVQRVAGAGRYLVPGFWDMHGHLMGDSSDTATILPLYLIHGVAGVREMWSDPPGVVVDSVRGTSMLQQLLLLRDDIESARVTGPRLVLTSAPLDGPFGPDDFVHVIRNASDASRVVGESATRGVEAINVFSGLNPEAYAAAASAARDRGLPLIGLPPVAVTFAEMVAAGHRVRDGLWEWRIACSSLADSLRSELRAAAARDALAPEAPERTQTSILDAAGTRLEATFDPQRCRQAARRIAADGIWQAPRLVYSSAGREAIAQSRQAAALLPGPMRESWQGAVARAEADGTGARERMAARDRGIVAALVAAEIPLLVSTEAYAGSIAIWGASVHDEMLQLVKAGASTAVALRAATLEPARALGRDRELGRVAAGYRADLVLLDADPLQDIENTRRIHAVIIGGRVLDKGALDGLRSSLMKHAAD